MKMRDLLRIKDRALVTIGPNESINAAIQKLVHYDRGSIPVCNEKCELLGIITERDIVRKCLISSDSLANIKIEDVMTKEVAVGTLQDDSDYAISVMKQKKIRHLPIVESQKVIGMVSMRDLLDVQLNETKAEIHYAGLLPRRTQRPIV